MSRRFAFASLFLVACGGAAAPAPGRAPESQAPEPTSVEEAQQQIAQAKADLTTRAGKEEPTSVAPSPGGAGAGTGATTDEAPKKSSAVEADHAVTSPACQSPCRAIASMRRAVGALCRMTGDADARCSDAKRTLKESELRISTCGC